MEIGQSVKLSHANKLQVALLKKIRNRLPGEIPVGLKVDEAVHPVNKRYPRLNPVLVSLCLLRKVLWEIAVFIGKPVLRFVIYKASHKTAVRGSKPET